MKDPYQLLGVSKTSSQDDIKNAYRALAKKLHPDLNPGNKATEAQFKDVASAYELIGTSEARAVFDRGETPEQVAEQQRRAYEQARAGQDSRGPFYRETQQGGGRYSYSFGGGADPDDPFADLFRQARGRGRDPRSNPDYPGEDHLYQMDVDFKESILGGEKEITLPTGRRLRVTIPPGIKTGVKLRFKGQGGPGMGRGPAGDAYVEIKVRPDTSGFTRVGQNLEAELQISFIEALLGADVEVPTLDGTVMLTIPSGVSSGARLRIRGKGVASANDRGDQIAVLKITLPKEVDPALQEAVRSWGEKFSYNPRVKV